MIPAFAFWVPTPLQQKNAQVDYSERFLLVSVCLMFYQELVRFAELSSAGCFVLEVDFSKEVSPSGCWCPYCAVDTRKVVRTFGVRYFVEACITVAGAAVVALPGVDDCLSQVVLVFAILDGW